MNRSNRTCNARRDMVKAMAVWPALASMVAVRAQATSPVVIGWLDVGRRETGERPRKAFHEAMEARGWKSGTQYVLEERHAEGRIDVLPALAQDLAARKPAVILASPSSSARAAAAAMPKTPIVLLDGDPVSSGLVTNLARPGGMITGLSNSSADLNQKVAELFIECMPKMQRLGCLADSTIHAHNINVANVRRVAALSRVEAVIVDMAKPEDIEPALARLDKAKVQALMVFTNAWFGPHMQKIIDAALAQRWPVGGPLRGLAERGGLLAYSPARGRMPRVAHYVDRILKGAHPGDLPIELPTTFDLFINMKTARSLGITVPQSILLRATQLLE